ncbi:MAG: hypothetical protein H0W72_16715 [Planctomycetes bacterium]|nr:hypothetical protein [Planctomycetota bacterium]
MTDPDPAAVEAVAEAICDNEDGCGLWGVYWEEIEEGDRDNFRSYARAAIAALSALGWVDGHRHAVQLDTVIREAVRAVGAEAELAAITCERDALRAALEKITRLPIYGHDPQDAIALATAAITAPKGTP